MPEPDEAPPARVDRRVNDEARVGGRRSTDPPQGFTGWSTGQLARHIGMSSKFVLESIQAGDIDASRFGREYRIATSEVQRYCRTKGYPVPTTSSRA